MHAAWGNISYPNPLDGALAHIVTNYCSILIRESAQRGQDQSAQSIDWLASSQQHWMVRQFIATSTVGREVLDQMLRDRMHTADYTQNIS